MLKRVYFDRFWGEGWPTLKELEPYFLGPPDEQWFYEGGNDTATLSLQGVDGTERLPLGSRVNIVLYMTGNQDHGVQLFYRKSFGAQLYSKGDLSRLGEFVDSLHGTPQSVGLFIPFERAWDAVKEFIETEGQVPKSIAWIAAADLPPETFPDP